MATCPHKIYHAGPLDYCGWLGQYHFSFGTSVGLVSYGRSVVLCGPWICHFGLLLLFGNASKTLATSVGLGLGGRRGLGHYVSGLCLVAFDLAFSICRRRDSLGSGRTCLSKRREQSSISFFSESGWSRTAYVSSHSITICCTVRFSLMETYFDFY